MSAIHLHIFIGFGLFSLAAPLSELWVSIAYGMIREGGGLEGVGRIEGREWEEGEGGRREGVGGVDYFCDTAGYP